MIAEKSIVIYNEKTKEVIAVVPIGAEYHTKEKIFEGTLLEFENALKGWL